MSAGAPRPDASNALIAARGYRQRGWASITVKPHSKAPFNPLRSDGKDWQNWAPTPEELERAFQDPSLNVGVILGARSGGLADVDLDCSAALALAPVLLPKTDAIFGRESKPRSHFLYASPGADTKRFLHPDTKATLVELRSSGAQTVFPGSRHPSGEAVEWAMCGDPADVRAPLLRGAVSTLAAACLLVEAWPGEGGRHDAQLTLAAFLARRGWKVERIAHFLSSVIGAAGGEPDPHKRRQTARDCVERVQTVLPLRGYPSLAELVGDAVARAVDDWLPGARTPNDGARTGEGEAQDPLAACEDQLALEFVAQYGGHLRYVEAWGAWFIWTGTHWKRDDTLEALDQVRDLARQACAGLLNDPSTTAVKFARSVRSGRSICAIERLARTDRAVAATTEQWDRNPWLLATPGGVVDLHNGALQPASPKHYVTKCAGYAPATGSPDQWLKFLNRVTECDRDLIEFLQRMAGYALTGDTSEHALFFLYGSGRNGKSVFVNTIAHILGDYAIAAPMEALTEQRHAQHPTELAMLRGARLVTAQETEQNKRWAESRIKSLTGGDPITARFMRQDHFTFTPTFKLLLAGNHRPSLQSVDPAMRARLHLVPFTVTIPEPERDPGLADALKAEGPQILQWMVEGAIAWRAHGLQPPVRVRAATDAYFENEDLLGQWLRECCAKDPTAQAGSTQLFRCWTNWAEARGEPPRSQKWFSPELEKRGFTKGRRANGQIVFAGLILRREPGA